MSHEQIVENIKLSRYDHINQIMNLPLVRFDFDDQICMVECPDLKMFELLCIHPTTDPCRFNNEECLISEQHQHEMQLYDSLSLKIFDLCQTIQKLPTTDILDEKIIRTSIHLQIKNIAQECDDNPRIMNYLKFLIANV